MTSIDHIEEHELHRESEAAVQDMAEALHEVYGGPHQWDVCKDQRAYKVDARVVLLFLEHKEGKY